MTILVALLLVASAVLYQRSRATALAHRAVAARLTLRPDGIVAGAETIDLPGDGTRAVLLLHGFGDTPQTLGYLATYLHMQGWAVRAPLLPGHGRTLSEFAASRAGDWVAFARTELESLRTRYEAVALVGLSMGGSVATILAAEFSDLPALVLLAPYLSMPTRVRRVARAHRAAGVLFPYLHGGGDRSIRDPAELALNLGYRFTTPRLLFELASIVDQARAAAPNVVAPTLMVQSRQDPRVLPDVAERAFALFTAPERRLAWTEGNGHVITVDYGRQVVFTAVAEWLAAHAAGMARDRLRGSPLAAERPWRV